MSETKHQERTELGDRVDAPLPTMLTHEEVYGHFERKDKDPNEVGMLDSTLDVLAFYANNSSITDSEDKRPSIDEATFVKAWLPHFYHGNQGREDIDPSVTLTWVNKIAGGKYCGSYHSVDVLRDGEVIYRVPPVYGRLNVVGGKDRYTSVAQLYKNMDDMLKRVPHAVNQQEKFFLDNIYEPADEHQDRRDFRADINLKYLYVLDEIFTYYGYETILTPELMSVKEQVMGKRTDGAQPVRELSTRVQSPTASEYIDDGDDDLFS